MSDYFNNIFDLTPKKTSKSGSIGDFVPKKKKQKSGGVTGMSNKEFSFDEFLSPENEAKDVFELPPSESTRVEGPLLSTAQEKAMSAQRWDNKTQEEKRIIKTQALAKNTTKDAPVTLKDSKRIKEESKSMPYTWALQQKIDKVEADKARLNEVGRVAGLNYENKFRHSVDEEITPYNLGAAMWNSSFGATYAAGLEAIKGVTGSDGGADWNRIKPSYLGVAGDPNFKGQSVSLSDAINKDWADKNRNLATLIDVVAPAGFGYKARKAYNLVDNTLDLANAARTTKGFGAFPGNVSPALATKTNLELTKELLKKSPLKNAYLLNPMAEKLNDASSSYRITGKLGLDDAMQSGVVRPPKLTADELFEQSRFPGVHQYDPDNLSFNRGFADKRYLQNPDDVVFKTSKYPTAKSGEINPVTGKEVRSFGHTNTTHLFDPKTGEKISEVPLQNVDIYSATPHWLKGYQKIPKTSESKKLKSKIDFPKNITPPVVPSQPIAPWQMQDLPGLHLKSTMSQGPISKIIDKKGNVNVNQALAIINKESGGKEKVNLIKKSLGDDIPKKMDYNDFRKTTQEQLIPLERKLVNHSSDYGLNRIGHLANTDDQLNSAISFADSEIKNLNNEIIKRSKGLEKNTGKELATQKKDIAELKETLRNFTLGREAVLKQKNNPFENQTLLLSNKSKFGRGSDAHGNPDETLGHAHFFTGGKNTGTLNVTQIQSDAFQGPYNIMPKNSKNRTALEKIQRSLKSMENLQANNKAALHKMKTEGINRYGTPVHKYELENMEDLVKSQEQSNILKRAEAENFTQKELLAKNHEERFLQEIVDYAAKRGDVNKIRLPTSETAAKIQGYVRTEKPKLNYAIEEDIFLLKNNKKQNIPDEIDMNTGVEIRYTDKVRAEKIKKLESQLDNKLHYDTQQQTILKKYSKQPKRVKKLFGVEPKTVKGENGTTWYEFDIPESFKKGKAEIKAFSATGAIGTGALLSQDKPTYRFGGMVEGDPEKPPKKKKIIKPWGYNSNYTTPNDYGTGMMNWNKDSKDILNDDVSVDVGMENYHDIVEQQRQESIDYINSPGFLRIAARSYDNPKVEQKERLKRVSSVPYEFKDAIGSKRGFTKGMYLPDKHSINLEHGGYKGIPLEEFNHSSVFERISSREKEGINKAIKKGSSEYAKDPVEVQNRLMMLKKASKDAGLYDYNKEDFTKEHLLKLKESIKNNPNKYDYQQINSLIENVESDNDLIWLMNNVAKNDTIPNITYAKFGAVVGDPIKPPKKKEPWEVPDFTDVTWTKTDLDYANKNYLCEDGACLDRSFQAYDKVVASFISGMPSSSQFKKDYNFTSAPKPNSENNYKGYYFPLSNKEGDNRVYHSDGKFNKGKPVSDKTQKWFENQKGFNIEKNDFTIDSWDASAKLIEEGGVNVFSEKRDKDYLYYEDDGARKGEDLWRSKTKAEKLKIYKSLPIGTYVGFNNYPDIYSGFNKEKGLASSGHSAQVVGYNEEGMPIIYDHEAYTTIDSPHLYTESDISNITIPKHSIGKTRDYFAKQNLLKNEQKDLNLDLTELYAEGDEGELKPFYETLVKYKKELMPELKINSKTYDEYAKNLLAIAMQETGGGTSFEHNLFGSSFGETHGLTQLNIKNIIDDPQLKEIAKWYGINENTDLSIASNSALASMIYHSRHQKVANKAYEKGRKNNKPLSGVRTYKEYKNKPLKDAARWFQGKKHIYKDKFFNTEEGKVVDLWWGDNTSPYGDWDGWQASLENIQAQLDEAKKGKYKAYKKDGKILIDKYTQGNIELTPSERALYSWQGYEVLKTGDAQKGSKYFKNVKEWRDLIKDK